MFANSNQLIPQYSWSISVNCWNAASWLYCFSICDFYHTEALAQLRERYALSIKFICVSHHDVANKADKQCQDFMLLFEVIACLVGAG